MWSSSSSNKKTMGGSSTSSSSYTSSSLSVPCPSNSNHLHLNPKTMEEVWKDINLASSDQYFSVPTPTPHVRHHNSNHNNFILQDFLARPFSNKDRNVPSSATSTTSTITTSSSLYTSHPVLTLNSASRLDASDPLLRPASHLPISSLSSFTNPVELLGSSSGFPQLTKKRVQQSSDISSGDLRHKRMIKNRESAARSRASKQAYTNELELEVAHLTQENAKLKKQQEEICLTAAAAKVPKRYTSLQRTSTAPF